MRLEFSVNWSLSTLLVHIKQEPVPLWFHYLSEVLLLDVQIFSWRYIIFIQGAPNEDCEYLVISEKGIEKYNCPYQGVKEVKPSAQQSAFVAIAIQIQP